MLARHSRPKPNSAAPPRVGSSSTEHDSDAEAEA